MLTTPFCAFLYIHAYTSAFMSVKFSSLWLISGQNQAWVNTTVKAVFSVEFNRFIPCLNSASCLKDHFKFPAFPRHFKYCFASMKMQARLQLPLSLCLDQAKLNYLTFAMDQRINMHLYWHTGTWMGTQALSSGWFWRCSTVNRSCSHLQETFCFCHRMWRKLFFLNDIWVFTAKVYFSLGFCTEKNHLSTTASQLPVSVFPAHQS